MKQLTFARSARFASMAVFLSTILSAHSATTQIASEPLITSTTTSVQPNVFLVLDDSGSMGWDYMPDNASNFSNGEYGAASSQCNGVFYDPNITYTPPVDSAGTSYANSDFSNAWDSGYNQTGSTTNLSTNFQPFANYIQYSSRSFSGAVEPAYYYRYGGTQTTDSQKDYYNSSSTFYQECNSAISTATITVGGSGSTSVNSVTVAGTTITSGATGSTTSTSTLATSIRDAINASTTGYRATIDWWSSNVVTIYAVKPADVGVTPVVNKTGTMTFTGTAFSNTTGASKFTKVIVSDTSGPGATDERTNFANWWSYYRTRMLTMKTATGLAFKPLCASTTASCNYRVGYMTINNNNKSTQPDLLELDTFDSTQKELWYKRLYSATPSGSTPLREALADVGRMYAHLLPSSNALNALTDTVKDPIQYACQQNFAILTTDGFWRTAGTPYKLNGTSSVGNQDYFEPRPWYDGSNYSGTTVTPYTTVQTRKSETSGAITTNIYGRTVKTIGAACSVPAVIPPNTTTANMLDSTTSLRKINVALFLSTTMPSAPAQCIKLSSGATTSAWMCRGASGSTAGALTGGSSSVTDSNNVRWYLVNNGASATGCFANNPSFSTSRYSTVMGACPGKAAISGNFVTTTHQSQTETTSGATATSVDKYTATQQTTQTTTNGVVGATSALTPATPTYVFTQNVSSTSTPPTTTTLSGWTDDTSNTVCVAAASLPTAGTTNDVPPYTTSSTAGTTTVTVLSTDGPTAGTPIPPTTTGTGGTSNTLADVAEYYYITDLRTTGLGNHLSAAPNGTSGTWNGTDISANVVPSSGTDAAAHQHMTTFTLGLGARGRMVFDPAYESATSGDYYAVKKGSTATTGICSWQTSGACNWPTPSDNAIENIDDLWHAAVNGRGAYYSATNPSTLATGLSSALAGVSARTGSAAAATTSTAFITQGDNFLFRSNYQTQSWSGELLRQQIKVSDGSILSAIDWSAQAKLDADTSRTIYFFDTNSTTNLSLFTLSNLTAASLDGYFSSTYIAGLTQLSCSVPGNCLTSWAANTSYTAGNIFRHSGTWYRVNTSYTSGAAFGATDTTNCSIVSGIEGLNLVAFIKGDRTYEGGETDNINGKFYRQRSHVLGDIVNSETIYVQGAVSPYFSDPGYTAFKTTHTKSATNLGRQPMVYVGANDGMLHAFYAADGQMNSTTGQVVSTGGVTVKGGEEAWAFIPRTVIPNLYKLADKEYKNTNYHQYYVDGSPVVADICVSNCTVAATAVWKTILVGGLNSGGAAYFALDITNPASPKALWEFTHANMGLSYGNPKVVKLKTGKWVVLLTSGYNNLGDGGGYLYVVDAYTGAPVTTVNGTGIIGTGVGDTTTPSGLGKLDAWLTTPGVDATAEAVYAGDLLGNLWRFDINNDVGAAGYDAQLLATFTGPSGATNTSPNNVQAITTKPLLSLNGSHRMIFVGTGRYLGAVDQGDTSMQSFYAIVDPLSTGTTPSSAIYPDIRASGFVKQTQTRTTCPAGTPSNICTTGQVVIKSNSSAVSLSSTVHGWYFDFPLSLSTGKSTGERVNTDPDIRNGTLFINTNEPNTSSCSVGGDSYQYQIDFRTGGALSSANNGVIGVKLANELASRAVVVTLADGTIKVYTQGSGGNDPFTSSGWGGGGGGGTTVTGTPSRKSWRELIQR